MLTRRPENQWAGNLSSRTWPILSNIEVVDGAELGGHGQRHARERAPHEGLDALPGSPRLGGMRAIEKPMLARMHLFP